MLKFNFFDPEAVATFYGCTIGREHSSEIITNRFKVTAKHLNSIKCVHFADTVNFIPTQIYAIFPKLKALIVTNKNSHNKLKEVSKSSFHNVKHLIYLEIRYNKILKLEGNTFEHAKHLEYISLRDNKIEVVHELAFQFLSKLKILDLGRNNIKYITGRTFSHFKHLMAVRLKHNVCTDKLFSKTDDTLKMIKWELDAYCKSLNTEVFQIPTENLVDKEITRLREQNAWKHKEIKELQYENWELRNKLEKCSVTKVIHPKTQMSLCATIQVTLIAIDSKFEYSNEQIEDLMEDNLKIREDLEDQAEALKNIHRKCHKHHSTKQLHKKIEEMKEKLFECEAFGSISSEEYIL